MKLTAAAVLVGMLATGCADDHHADLEAFVDETAREFHSTHIPGTDPSPATSSAERVAYTAGTLRSPFQPPSALKPIAAAGQPMVAPDFEREQGHLEAFPLAQLRLVGNLAGRQVHVALVRDPDGLVHSVGVGDRMGTDFGRILAVGDGGIELVEIVRDAGGWIERPRLIPLAGEREDE